MEITKVKALVEILTDSALTTLEMTDASGTLKLSKNGNQAETIQSGVQPQFATAPSVETNQIINEPITPVETSEKSGEVMTSPLVGTFYDRPSPDRPCFVEVGMHVQKGQVICIIEAMKVMNEMKAPVSGIVSEIIAMNGAMVEFNSPLVRISEQ